MFDRTGLIKIPKIQYNEDDLFMIAVEAGAEDMKNEDPEYFEIYTDFERLDEVRAALDEKKISIASAEQTMIPKNFVELDGKQAEQMLKLMDILDEHEDVQDIYANFDIDDEVMANLAG